jgi:DNA-binding response OmpR family regulator
MKKRILLVEDDHCVREYCCCLLSKEKYLVTACSSAAEALTFMRGGSYDILLTDFNLGDGFGTDLLALSKLVAPAARALLMTGDCAQGAALRKPFTGRELLSAVAA